MSFEIQNQYTLLSKYSVYLRAKLQMNGRKQGGNLKKKILARKPADLSSFRY